MWLIYNHKKMIALVTTKDNKKTAKNITSELEKKNFQVWNYWRDAPGENPKEYFKNHINEFSAIVFILNKEAITDSLIVKLYQIAYNNQKEIILYLQTKLDHNLPNWFFLENHDWINAYEVSAETATKGLTELLKEILEENNNSKIIHSQKQEETAASTISKNKSILIGLGIIAIAVILLVIILSPNKESAIPIPNITNEKNPEQLLIGTWGLADYKDNIPRTPQDIQEFQQAINNLKRNFRFIFYPDHTFERLGFAPQPEKGRWRLDKQNMFLYISDFSKTGEDRLQILTLNENQLIFEIATRISPNQVSVVRFTLYKIPQQNTNNQ